MDTDDKLKYCFTAYLNKALDREKKNYIDKKVRQGKLLDIDSTAVEEGAGSEQEWDRRIWEETQELFCGRNGCLEVLAEWFDPELEQAVMTLSESEQKILFLKTYLDLTYKEIGAFMGLNGSQAASVYHYARKKLRKRLEDQYGI